jgi:hypothetical protein
MRKLHKGTMTGDVRKVSPDLSQDSPGGEECVCEFVILTADGEFCPMQYVLPSRNLAEAVRKSILEGTKVEIDFERWEGNPHYFVTKLKIIGQ